ASPRASRRPRSPAGGARTRRRRPQALGRRLPELAGALARRRLEIVDGLDPVQLALETVELGAERRDRSAVARPVAIELREDLSTLPHDRLVFRVLEFVEQRHLLVIVHRLDALHPDL